MDTVLERQLLSGEKLLWSGRSEPGIILSQRDVFLIPFSLFWAGFALFWNISVWREGAPIDFQLFGVPFLLVGVYITIGRFFHDAWLRRRFIYAVTDRRILIVKAGGLGVRSLDIHRLPDLELSEGRHGRGAIQFGHGGFSFGMRGFGWWIPAMDSTPQFIGIDRARSVYELIQKQAAERPAA